MSKREAALKSAWMRELDRQCPHYHVLRYATAGAPDRSIVGDGFQSNWEAKHATPYFSSRDNQELFCARLAAASHCRYVFWRETTKGTGKQTLIVHPRCVLDGSLTPEAWTSGYDHRWLVQQVKKAHGMENR